MKFVLFIAAALAVVAAERFSYEGYQVLKTERLTQKAAEFLQNLQVGSVDEDDFDFWTDPLPSAQAEIMASPERLDMLKEILENLGISYTTKIPNVQRLIDETNTSIHQSKGLRQLDWNDYYNHEEINAYLEEVAEEADYLNVVSIGKTYEGRDMKVLQITKAGEGKPNIWIEAGIHAREWIAHAMGTYVINELVHGPDGPRLIDELNFHILPVANPDGYEFSINGRRLWRKTRSVNKNSICKGVDPNRNWPSHWGESGSSTEPCSDAYQGSAPFTEQEMVNIRDYVLKLSPVPIHCHTLHSYSQVWLYPYGYAVEYPENIDEIKELAQESVEALEEVHGTHFRPMSAGEFYVASGASDDWYKEVLGARFVYTSELRDKGHYGFVLPTDQIIPSGEELWAGLTVAFDKMIELSK